MAQITSGIRGILSSAAVYDFFQNVMGANKSRSAFARTFIRAKSGDRILDLGCGTADYLNFLPGVEYVGWDISDDYIAAAQTRFGNRGSFEKKDFCNMDATTDARFDIVLIAGVLHHLDDKTALKLLEIARHVLQPSGRVLCIEPCFAVKQNPVARLLVSLDRGQHVRNPEGYQKLAQPFYSQISMVIQHQAWIPYTHCIMECGL